MFEIATVLLITHVSMCHTNLWSFPVLYSMPISVFTIPSSKIRFEIEPVIRDFIDCMEPGTPRVEIESYRREDSFHSLRKKPI